MKTKDSEVQIMIPKELGCDGQKSFIFHDRAAGRRGAERHEYEERRLGVETPG